MLIAYNVVAIRVSLIVSLNLDSRLVIIGCASRGKSISRDRLSVSCMYYVLYVTIMYVLCIVCITISITSISL